MKKSKLFKWLTKGKTLKIVSLIILIIFVLLKPSESNAANARGYVAQRDGTKTIFVYYKYSYGDSIFSNGKKLDNDLHFNHNIGIVRPMYYMKIGEAIYGDDGLIVNPQVWFGFAGKDLEKSEMNSSRSGFIDPIIASTFWLVNSKKEQFWIGLTPIISVPLGRYDKNKSLNIGENRWSFKPEIGIVKGIKNKLFLEIIFNTEVFSDNDKFYYGNEVVSKSQSPLMGLETHCSFTMADNWFLSLDYFYSKGGRTKIDGVKQRDSQNNHAIGLSSFWKIGENQLLMLEYVNRFAVENGIEFDTIGFRWGYVF